MVRAQGVSPSHGQRAIFAEVRRGQRPKQRSYYEYQAQGIEAAWPRQPAGSVHESPVTRKRDVQISTLQSIPNHCLPFVRSGMSLLGG